MKTIRILQAHVKKERGGSFMVNYDYLLTDELDNKKAGSGSLAVSQQEVIQAQVEHNVMKKLLLKTAKVIHPQMGYLTADQINEQIVNPPKRGPGRPPNPRPEA